MLKSEMILRRMEISGDKAAPLALPSDRHHLNIAEDLIRLISAYTGRTRGELDQALREYEGDRLDYPVIRGLAHVLKSRCVFANDPRIPPEKLRAAAFAQGPVTCKQDMFNSATREGIVSESLAGFGLKDEKEFEALLFADLSEEQVLLETRDFPSPEDLISRYNLEVARGLLYWAREVRISVRDTYKDVFRYIKLFKLMHTISPDDVAGYHILLHGPISPFVKSTIRYGLQFAKFMPALLLCQKWRMDALIQPPGAGRPLSYALDDSSELRTHFKGSGMFDSRLEEDFAKEFEEKYGGAKRKWELAREDELILVGDTVMIPDFSLTHRKDGRRVLIEIIGFWHPQYIGRKLKKVREAGRSDLILLIYESANVAKELFEEASAGEVLVFRRKPVLKKVMEAAERCAVANPSPSLGSD